jgi:mannose-6-phosphate isomerase
MRGCIASSAGSHEMQAMINPIQRYAWGSRTALARLQGRTPSGEHEAELWMGAHPAAPSLLRVGNRDQGAAVSLLDRIAQDPNEVLGVDVFRAFGARLPFLLKVLAIEAPLSLQVHPDPKQAAEGFVADEARGIPLDAPERRYRDPYAKPEVLCAVTEVEALCGFRDPTRSAVLLEGLGVDPLVPIARGLVEGQPSQAIREVLARLLTWPVLDRPALVEAVAAAARRHAAGTEEPSAADPSPTEGPGTSHRGGEFATAYAWAVRLAELHPADPGVVCALLLNHLRLHPGEAIVLPAGNLHAYLHGVGVEIMGNSDNVLRGGLTPKHIDVPELLRILQTAPTTPRVVTAQPAAVGEEVFVTEFQEFRLSRVRLHDGPIVALEALGPEILLCLDGEVSAKSGTHHLLLRPGHSVFVPASASPVELAGQGTIYRASPGGPSPS